MKQAELEKRVKVLEDIEEIKKMHREYLLCLSNYQWEDMVDYFAEDAVASIAEDKSKKGKEGIREMIVGVINKRISPLRPRGGQIMDQPIITVDGDTARGQWIMNRFVANDTAKRHWELVSKYFDYPETTPAPSPQCSRGKYEVEYIRENGKWKFRTLKWIMPWPEPS